MSERSCENTSPIFCATKVFAVVAVEVELRGAPAKMAVQPVLPFGRGRFLGPPRLGLSADRPALLRPLLRGFAV